MYDLSSDAAERPFCNADEGLSVVVPQGPWESTNLGEKIRDSSIYHSRPSIAAGGSAPGKKM